MCFRTSSGSLAGCLTFGVCSNNLQHVFGPRWRHRFGDGLKRDVVEDQTEIEKQFKKIVDFCIDQAQANLFLIDKSSLSQEFALIRQLVDLRLVHFVSSRITVSKQPGKIYEAYMLDVSQYAGSRARRNFEIVPFWKPGEANLRRLKLIYPIQ